MSSCEINMRRIIRTIKLSSECVMRNIVVCARRALAYSFDIFANLLLIRLRLKNDIEIIDLYRLSVENINNIWVYICLQVKIILFKTNIVKCMYNLKFNGSVMRSTTCTLRISKAYSVYRKSSKQEDCLSLKKLII